MPPTDGIEQVGEEPVGVVLTGSDRGEEEKPGLLFAHILRRERHTFGELEPQRRGVAACGLAPRGHHETPTVLAQQAHSLRGF
ncbi:MAG TPA: hypothetical protein VMD50_22010, partial [Mycobacterium sp.]|nr:hypothetical protein [Mycobacterium sp.]